MSSLLEHGHGEKTHFSRNEKRTFSLSQMNNVELARTWSWRENALFKEREKNVFVRPEAQDQACSNMVMARKRTFRGTRKELVSSTTHHLNHLINSKQHLAGKMKQSAIRWTTMICCPSNGALFVSLTPTFR